MKRSTYSFLREAEEPVQDPQNQPINDPTVDPNEQAQVENPVELPENTEQQNQEEEDAFEPLIKSIDDVPHSEDRANTLKIAAQIRNIEAKTKETLAKTKQIENPPAGEEAMTDPNGGAGIDPNTGMPMDPNMQIDPMTGQPLNPGMMQQQPQDDDPLRGLGDATAPQSPMGMGAVDPMTGMPTGDGTTKSFTAVGRAYKLKKIYDILDGISRLLHISSDIKLQELYKEVDTAFELFRLVINNLKIYKEKVDELIVLYYALLKDICIKIEDIYKERKLECSLTESKLLKRAETLVNEGIEE